MTALLTDPATTVTSPAGDVESVNTSARSAQERLNELAGHLNAVHAAIVEVVAEALADESWGSDGVRSPQQWLCWQLGISHGESQRLIALAQARQTHPAVSAMFGAGQLSTTQAAIATSVDPTRDREAAELVTSCTIPQLRLFVRAMHHADTDHQQRPAPTAPPVDPTEPPTAPAAPPAAAPTPLANRSSSLEFWLDDEGWLSGRFQLDPESGRIVDGALRRAREQLFHERRQATDPGLDQRVTGRRVGWADALVEIARQSLDNEETPARRERFRINLFLDPDADLPASWSDRTAVPQCLLDKLTCHGTLVPTFVQAGKPVSVGRALRIVPDRARRLVLYRDGHHCRIPWCQRTRWLDAHHLVHWANGGATDTDNLIAVCDTCHHAIHQGRLNVTGHADDVFGLHFSDRTGQPIEYQTPTPAQPTRPPPDPQVSYVHPLGERLDHRDVWVNPSIAS